MKRFGKRKKIQFTDKVHPFHGILSAGIGIVCIIVTLALFIGAGKAKGNAAAWYGYTGMVAMLASLTGLILAIRCFQKEDIYFLTPTIGVVLNGFMMLVYLALIFVGVL